jgi:hypothetical protein
LISFPASQKFAVDICEAHVATDFNFVAVAPWERRMTMMQFESSFILVYWSNHAKMLSLRLSGVEAVPKLLEPK